MQLATPVFDVSPAAWPVTAPPCIGYAASVRQAYAGADLSDLTGDLVAAVQAAAVDPGALLDLAALLMLQGGDLAAEGAVMQRHAIALQQSYQIRHGSGLGLRILAFVTAGDFMANTPLDFLLAGSDATLILHFVDAETPNLGTLPAHDIAFMAIGESPETADLLRHMQSLLADWPTPIFNHNITAIMGLTRDHTADL